MYNPSGGGLLASITLAVGTRISHQPASADGYILYQVGATAKTLTNSFVQCGGTMDVRRYTRVGSTSVNLPYETALIYPPQYIVIGYHSEYRLIQSSSTHTVESEGYFLANPSKCMQFTNKVTDTWSWRK